MTGRKKGQLDTAEPVPMDQQAAEAKEPAVLVLLGTVVELYPQRVWPSCISNGRQLVAQMEESGCDVQVWVALVYRQVVHILSGMVGQIQDADCGKGHALVLGVCFGNGTQMRQPDHLWTVHCNEHILFREALGALFPLRKGQPLQLHQEIVSLDLALQLGALLSICTVLLPGRDLSAEVTLTQARSFGELDVLEVQLHQGQEGGIGGKLAGGLVPALEVLNAQLMKVLHAHVHGHMDGGFIWHPVTNLLKEVGQEEHHAVFVGSGRASSRGQWHGVAMDRGSHTIGSHGSVELGGADSMQGPEGLVTNRDAPDREFQGRRAKVGRGGSSRQGG